MCDVECPVLRITANLFFFLKLFSFHVYCIPYNFNHFLDDSNFVMNNLDGVTTELPTWWDSAITFNPNPTSFDWLQGMRLLAVNSLINIIIKIKQPTCLC